MDERGSEDERQTENILAAAKRLLDLNGGAIWEVLGGKRYSFVVLENPDGGDKVYRSSAQLGRRLIWKRFYAPSLGERLTREFDGGDRKIRVSLDRESGAVYLTRGPESGSGADSFYGINVWDGSIIDLGGNCNVSREDLEQGRSELRLAGMEEILQDLIGALTAG